MNSLIGQHMLICWNYWLKLQSSARTVKGIKCYPIFQTTNWPAGCTDADRRHQTPSQEQRTRCDSQPHLQWEYNHWRDNPAVREPESFKMGSVPPLLWTEVPFSKAVQATNVLKQIICNKGWSEPLFTWSVEIQDTMENCLPGGDSLKSFCW